MKTHRDNDNLNISFEESLVSTTVVRLKQACHQELTNQTDVHSVKVDLSQVEMIDSLGLNFLVNLFGDVQKNGWTFVISGISEANRKLFELVNLQEHMKLN